MKTTLRDIAKRLGVSASTVQRALNGLPGVGDGRREDIRRLAGELGYRCNFTASSLKKGSKRIGVILPEPANDNRFYARYLWDGALKCSRDFTDLSIETLNFAYVRNPGRHEAKLREALAGYRGRLDGLLTMGSPDSGTIRALAELAGRDMPTVFVGTDSGLGNRLCCVRAHDEMAGRLAADLLVSFVGFRKGDKVLLTGDFSIADQFHNARGFERRLLETEAEARPETVRLEHYSDLDEVERRVRAALDGDPAIRAAYSTSARNTPPMCRAAAGRVCTIGSDIFPESAELAGSGALNAIIHKRPAEQAYQAMQTLINQVVKGESPVLDVIKVAPAIVMKSNLECFV